MVWMLFASLFGLLGVTVGEAWTATRGAASTVVAERFAVATAGEVDGEGELV